MILVNESTFVILSPGAFNIPGDNYTLLIQDKLSKNIYIYNLISISQSSLYWKFNNTFTLPDNEYEYILIYNPKKYDIDVNINNINKSVIESANILIAGTDILTANIYILKAGGADPEEIKPLDKGLLYIGSYKANTIDYENKNTFKVYEG